MVEGGGSDIAIFPSGHCRAWNEHGLLRLVLTNYMRSLSHGCLRCDVWIGRYLSVLDEGKSAVGKGGGLYGSRYIRIQAYPHRLNYPFRLEARWLIARSAAFIAAIFDLSYQPRIIKRRKRLMLNFPCIM